VDLLVQNSKNELIIIEIQNTRELVSCQSSNDATLSYGRMQVSRDFPLSDRTWKRQKRLDMTLDYLFRLLYITSKAITENISESETYSTVVKVITISVLYFDLGQGEDYIYKGTTNFLGLHSKDQLQLSDGQQKLFQKQSVEQIFPEHYLIRISQFDEKNFSFTQDKFDEWVYFLKTSEIKESFTAKGLVEARKKLTVMNLPADEQHAYQRFLDNVRTEASVAETLKFEAEQKIIKNRNIEIAKNLLKNNIDKHIISLTTDLTLKEIEHIENE